VSVLLAAGAYFDPQKRHPIAQFIPALTHRGFLRKNAKGRAEGEAKGKAEALMRLLERRFGPIPDDLHSQVAGADLVTLDRWFDRALDASALDAVFGDAKH